MPIAAIDDDRSLLIDWAFTLDACLSSGTDSSSVIELANDYANILGLEATHEALWVLGQIAVWAPRVEPLATKYLAGRVSRGAWSSFLANAPIESSVKERIRSFNNSELGEFAGALRSKDYQRIAALLWGTGW